MNVVRLLPIPKDNLTRLVDHKNSFLLRNCNGTSDGTSDSILQLSVCVPISNALTNQQFGVNFNTYINQYRVKYVNGHVKANPEVTKVELYHLAGFGSISTMKRAKKKV